MAYCWVCKTDVVVWKDYTDDFSESYPRCTQCDTRLNQWGVDPGIKREPLEALERYHLDVVDRSAGQACSSGDEGSSCGCGSGGGGGCGDGAGCASTGGGGGCWTPATEGRAAVIAQAGERGCRSCGIKRECADKRRENRRHQSELLAVAN